MAKNGFRLLDAEMHVTAPVDLWQRYLWDNAARFHAL